MYAPRNVVKGDFKRIILCCDGTWQAADKGFRSVPSNVVKFSRAIDRVDKQTIDGHEREIQQVVYYQSGVATGNSGSYARKFYGMLRMHKFTFAVTPDSISHNTLHYSWISS